CRNCTSLAWSTSGAPLLSGRPWPLFLPALTHAWQRFPVLYRLSGLPHPVHVRAEPEAGPLTVTTPSHSGYALISLRRASILARSTPNPRAAQSHSVLVSSSRLTHAYRPTRAGVHEP